MGANVTALPSRSQGGVAETSAKKARWGSGHTDPVAHDVELRRELGLAPKTIQHLIEKLPDQAAAIIRAFHRHAATLRHRRFVRKIREADEQREAPPFVAATKQLAQDADANEEAAETAFHLDPSDANLDRWIRAQEAQQLRGDALLMAAYAERERRRREVRA